MSKEIFEKNLQAMDKWYPEFVKLVREKNSEEDINILVETSFDGEKIFKIENKGRCLYLNGKRNVKEPIEMWINRLGTIPKFAPVFLYGLGSGRYLKALIENTTEDVNVVVYEPSIEIFKKMLAEVDLTQEIENRPIAFVIEGINETEYENIMKKILVLENVEFLIEEIHPNYKELFPEQIVKYVRMVQREVEQMMVQYHTGKKLSGNTAQNILRNMRYVCEGYNTKGLSEVLPHDRAAILVSAGPSLNKNIHELKRAKNKLFIMAVDTAVKPLLKAGIVPDIMCTLDAKKDLELFESEGIEQIPVVAPSFALHEMLTRQKAKKIFYNDGYVIPWMLYHINGKEFYSVKMGGSVACAAFSTLYLCGFKTIVMVGQDLAFTNGKTHADGTFQDKMPEINIDGLERVKGNYEDTVPIESTFRIFLEWFNNYIKGAKEHMPEFRVINATEGGAYIEGTEVRTLSETLDELCDNLSDVDYMDRIANMKPQFTREEQEKAVEYLKELPEKYQDIVDKTVLLEKAYKKLEKIARSGNISKKKCLSQLKKIKQLTEKIAYRPEYQLIGETMVVADYVIRSEFYYEEENNETDIKETARKGILFCDILKECALLLKGISEEMILEM